MAQRQMALTSIDIECPASYKSLDQLIHHRTDPGQELEARVDQVRFCGGKPDGIILL